MGDRGQNRPWWLRLDGVPPWWPWPRKGRPDPTAIDLATIDLRPTVLVADSDEVMRDWFTATFTATGWQVRHAISGDEALRIIGPEPPDVVVLDHWLPDRPGLE